MNKEQFYTEKSEDKFLELNLMIKNYHQNLILLCPVIYSIEYSGKIRGGGFYECV